VSGERYFGATKILPMNGRRPINAAEVRQLIERSLTRLRVGNLDIIQLHRVSPVQYEVTLDRLMPDLDRLRAEGKVRFLGIIESSQLDPQHHMLSLPGKSLWRRIHSSSHSLCHTQSGAAILTTA